MGGDDEASVSRRPSYREPRYLTPLGREAFHDAVAEYAEALGEHLDRVAYRSLASGRSPEHTADSVCEARRAVGEPYPSDVDPTAGQPSARRNRSLRGAICVTAASVGSQAIPGGLEATWQVAIYGALMLIGVIGLVEVWRGRRGPGPPQPPDEASGRGEDPMNLP